MGGDRRAAHAGPDAQLARQRVRRVEANENEQCTARDPYCYDPQVRDHGGGGRPGMRLRPPGLLSFNPYGQG